VHDVQHHMSRRFHGLEKLGSPGRHRQRAPSSRTTKGFAVLGSRRSAVGFDALHLTPAFRLTRLAITPYRAGALGAFVPRVFPPPARACRFFRLDQGFRERFRAAGLGSTVLADPTSASFFFCRFSPVPNWLRALNGLLFDHGGSPWPVKNSPPGISLGVLWGHGAAAHRKPL